MTQLLHLPTSEHHPASYALSFLFSQPEWQDISFPHPDISIENAELASIKIATVRSLQQQLAYPPFQHSHRAVILCGLDLATLPAQQAMLKLLEEPPTTVDLIATTTQPQKLLPTIVSRCAVVSPKNIPKPLLMDLNLSIDIKGDQKKSKGSKVLVTYTKLRSLSPSETLATAQELSQRENAVQAITALLEDILLIIENPTAQTQSEQLHAITSARACTEALTWLEQNSHVGLTVEHLFFKINNLYSRE